MGGFEKKFINKEQFPLVVEPTERDGTLDQFLKTISQNKEDLKKDLLKNGALLFRNFPVANEHDFASVIKSLGAGKFIDYIGGDSPRNKIIDGVYTSTEAPPSVKIPLHNELSFVKNYPKHIYFYCHVAPQANGETIIADARKVFQSVDESVKKRFIEKNLRYSSCYYYQSRFWQFVNKYQKSHKSWIDVFETHDKEDVENKCRQNDFDFKWHGNDWLQISQTRPAVLSHPITNEQVWFNQVHLYDFNPKLLGFWRYLGAKLVYMKKHKRLHEAFFGDHSRIPQKDIYHILDVLDRNTVYFPWKKGDVLVLDNVLAMHGRATFTGKRRVMTAMTG